MARFQGIVTIKETLCKGCSLCVVACPLGLISQSDEINQKGYHQAIAPDRKDCSGCGLCALMCPEACIEIRRERREE